VIYVLDTSILIDLIKNLPPAITQRVDSLTEDALLCMSFVTWTELLKGVERSARKPEVLRRLHALARQVAVLYPSGPAVCGHCAEQFTRLKDAGTLNSANDLWIACHALAENATLVTHNNHEFQWVRELGWNAGRLRTGPVSLRRCSRLAGSKGRPAAMAAILRKVGGRAVVRPSLPRFCRQPVMGGAGPR
jgi:tRNA(fMet)-specific endonuclease VapC